MLHGGVSLGFLRFGMENGSERREQEHLEGVLAVSSCSRTGFQEWSSCAMGERWTTTRQGASLVGSSCEAFRDRFRFSSAWLPGSRRCFGYCEVVGKSRAVQEPSSWQFDSSYMGVGGIQGGHLILGNGVQLLVYDYHGSRLRLASEALGISIAFCFANWCFSKERLGQMWCLFVAIKRRAKFRGEERDSEGQRRERRFASSILGHGQRDLSICFDTIIPRFVSAAILLLGCAREGGGEKEHKGREGALHSGSFLL